MRIPDAGQSQGSLGRNRNAPASSNFHMAHSVRIPGVALIGALAALSSAQFDPLHTIKWSTLQSGQHSRIERPTTRVLNNEAELQAYWRDAMGESPTAAPRGIEFGKEMLLAIHLGDRPTGGYKVHVQSISRTRAAELTVEYVETEPAPGSANIQVRTSPWTLVRMERSAGNLNFRKRTQTSRYAVLPAPPACGCCSACGCGSHGPPPVYGNPYDRPVRFDVMDEGEFSQIPWPGVTILRNEDDLRSYWVRNEGHPRYPARFDDVDFRREQLVAVNVGQLKGTGYRVYVEGVEQSSLGERTVRVLVVYAAIQPPILLRHASPFVVLRMDRSPDAVVLAKRNYQPSLGGDRHCGCRCPRCWGG
jgi:hypothetical protein